MALVIASVGYRVDMGDAQGVDQIGMLLVVQETTKPVLVLVLVYHHLEVLWCGVDLALAWWVHALRFLLGWRLKSRSKPHLIGVLGVHEVCLLHLGYLLLLLLLLLL